MRPGATPTDAIDLAIEIATVPRFAHAEISSQELPDSLFGKESAINLLTEIAATQRDMSEKLNALWELVGQASQIGDSDFAQADAIGSAPTLREWMACEPARSGLSVLKSTTLRAESHSSVPLSENHVDLVFSGKAIEVDRFRLDEDAETASLFRSVFSFFERTAHAPQSGASGV